MLTLPFVKHGVAGLYESVSRKVCSCVLYLYYFGGDRVIILNLQSGQLAIVHIISMHHFPVLKVRT